MRFGIKYGALLLPALAVATPALAINPPTLSDSQQPGSVIIYPKFVNGPAVTTFGDGAVLPRTEIEIGAVCPPTNNAALGTVCPEHQSVKVRFHYVCPGLQNVNSNICPEEDFDVVLSVWGKLAFSADGIAINSNSPPVPAAPCARGYLIGWVINPNNDAPIKFDGLVGNAVIRGPAFGTPATSNAVSAYSPITVQADPALATGAAITTPTDELTGQGSLVFDGGPGHYLMITGRQFVDVKYDKTAAGGPAPTAALNTTYLIMLTLDVRSNQPNNPVFVPLKFYNESASPPSATNTNFEKLTSTFWEFVCWTQVSLATNTDPFFGGPININLTQAQEGTRKGLVDAGPAQKNPELASDTFGPSSLIVLVETNEGTSGNGFNERKYNFNANTSGFPVPTTYVPFPF
jgi:hypothetical protein